MENKKIVVVGGGTGSFILLRGLKQHPVDITAIVTMFDSGGSSGLLRDEFGVLPPGDVRRCLVALSEGSREETLRELFNYRFDKDGSLKGHSFGNLLITALTHITGNTANAIQKAGELLNIKGRVLPVSLDNAHLCAELEDGKIIEGETNIDIPQHDPDLKIKRLFLKPPAKVFEEAVNAMRSADLIVIGPGDLYTSLIPNFLTEGFSAAVRESKAKKVFVMNITTKVGETNGFVASDFAKEILRYLDLSKLDYAICNNKIPRAEILVEYKKENKEPVAIDKELEKYVGTIITADVISKTEFMRHDSHKLAKIIAEI